MAMMVPMAERKPVVGRQLADRLEALRQAHGWTQGQLVIKTKLDKSTVYHLLAGGRKDPPIGTVMRFAEAFNVSLDELVGLKPLHVPEIHPEEPSADRLAALEEKVARLAEALAPALERTANLVQHESREQSRDTQPQQRSKRERPA